MKMMVGLMVVAAAAVFALMIPASSAVVLELEDVITRDAYENLVERGAMNGIAMTKTVISNPILEEALVTYSKNKLGGGTIFNCGETCLMGTCYTPGCLCDQKWRVCYKNSLQAVQEEALLPNFARKDLAGFAN